MSDDREEVAAGVRSVASDGEPLEPGLKRLSLNTTVAHPARVYDYWLGGKDNFAADRAAAERVIQVNPGIVPATRSNRAFLKRAVRHLALECGIRQFLDLGTGLPSFDNVHEVAQAAVEDSRVVYVDNDPIVLVHARALLTGNRGVVRYVQADLREPEPILEEAANTLDFGQPIAVLCLMTMQFITPPDDPYALLAEFVERTVPGSYLALSHPVNDGDEGTGSRGTAHYNQMVATPMRRRTPAEIARFFDGLELVEPGLVLPERWRPDGAPEPGRRALGDDAGDRTDADPVDRPVASPALGAVARKPAPASSADADDGMR